MDDMEEWDVRRSLFDGHMSRSMEANLEYMWKNFGFYFPEADLLTDPEGLLKYLVRPDPLIHILCYLLHSFLANRQGASAGKLQSKAAKILPLDRLAEYKQDQVHRGHGAGCWCQGFSISSRRRNLYRPPPAGTGRISINAAGMLRNCTVCIQFST